MDTRLDRIEEKLDKLVEIQTEIKIDVAEHIRRTAIAEDNIVQLAETLKPIQQHVAMVKGVGQFLAWAIGIITAIATFYRAAIK